MNTMYKVISFDIGGTLIETKSNSDYNMNKLAELLSLPKEEVKNAYKNIFQKRKGTLLELTKEFCNLLNITLNDEIISFFKEKFSQKNNQIINNPSAIKVIKEIKNMGYKIILVSNSCCLFNTTLDKEIMENIDSVFYSYDLGYTKNDNQIYRLIEKELNCLPSEFLHIGDTLKSDYTNPIKNGWNAIYYSKEIENGVESITSLEEILHILRGNYKWRKRN